MAALSDRQPRRHDPRGRPGGGRCVSVRSGVDTDAAGREAIVGSFFTSRPSLPVSAGRPHAPLIGVEMAGSKDSLTAHPSMDASNCTPATGESLSLFARRGSGASQIVTHGHRCGHSRAVAVSPASRAAREHPSRSERSERGHGVSWSAVRVRGSGSGCGAYRTLHYAAAMVNTVEYLGYSHSTPEKGGCA